MSDSGGVAPSSGTSAAYVTRCVRHLLVIAGPSLATLWLWPFPFSAWIYIIGSVICAASTARVREDRNVHSVGPAFVAVIVLAHLVVASFVVWVAAWLTGWLSGFFVPAFCSLLAVGHLFFSLDDALSPALPNAGSPHRAGPYAKDSVRLAPEPVQSSSELRWRRPSIERTLGEISQLSVFSADTPELEKAWKWRDTERVEKILREGEKQTHLAWDKGIESFNSCIAHVDVARVSLSHLLGICEHLLAQFNIDYAAIPVPSRMIEGFMPVAPARQKHISEKLNYAQGYGAGMARVATGQVPWQAGAVAMIGMGLWQLSTNSKVMRQLKEIEGKVLENAAAARGDLEMFRQLIHTRLLPQFDGLFQVFEKLQVARNTLTIDFNKDSPETREKALRLAFALLEGKRLLEMVGGN